MKQLCYISSLTLLCLFLLCVSFTANAQNPNAPGGIFACVANQKYVLAVPNSNFRDGQSLILWEFHSDLKDQVFVLAQTGTSFSIIPREAQRLCVAIPEGKLTSGNRIIVWNNNFGQEQLWRLDNLSGMEYVIRSVLNPDWVIGVDGTPRNNSSISIQRYNGSDTQKWFIVPKETLKYELFKAVNDNR